MMLRVPDGVELVSDPSPARWVVEGLQRGEHGVTSVVPLGFEAYTRIFHPTYNQESLRPVRWSALAERRGVELGPDTGFKEIGALDPHLPTWNPPPPQEGNLPLEQVIALAAALETFTYTSDRCWYCIWEGYGFWWSGSHSPIYPPDTDPEEIAAYGRRAQEQDASLRPIPRVEAPDRAYFLFRGPLSAAASFSQFEPWHQSPNLWWPEDRAWCVASEIDIFSTYVAGSRECVEQIIANGDLEAIKVEPDTGLDLGLY